MAVEAQVENIPLNKRRLLEYLEGQKGPATAKAASIDLDTRASTATEMLERCAGQGLVEREANQRPREYVLTDAGRKRLNFFRSGQGKSDPESADPVETNPGSEGEREQARSVNISELRGEVTRQFDGLREDMRDLFEVLNLRPVPGEGSRDRAGRIRHRLESLAEQGKADAHSEAVRNLYRAQYELRSLGFLDSKQEMKTRIADLEGAVGKETAEQIERLVSLEVKIGSSWGENAEALRSILELRDALHFPASVFGLGRKSDDADAAEE